ncbi:CaiB/BaiF CoA transferase family protein [Hydrogenophaga sp. BPS33]|uniref:CaiB/BaiF CoA transferase family protein n=1 Tax=Hydrogenophaga sp. BPS33 TaxID=2651974 RepID=UPI00131F5363|nr:CoA transferase [Hydrogenophaga sp. BPS33]QHE87512.1 CoA transferase [Hydrogenophaga sp. BPS33]
MSIEETQTSRPLTGIRILDLSRALSGPFCTMTLGDLGATVIKVEPSENGDMTRLWGPFSGGQSVYYLSANRSKQSLSLDFRHADAMPLLRRLALDSDVVIENFKPGVAEAMGLGVDVLRQLNPRLIYASISGFGSEGPARDAPGFDQIAQGHGGLMALTGAETPTRVGVAIADMTAGLWTALGIVAALRQAEATGVGERVETSLLASMVSMLGVQGQRYLSVGDVPKRTGNANPVIAPYGTFETADGPINLAPATEAMWHSLCHELDLDALCDDPDYATNVDRVRHRDRLHRVLEERMRQRPRAEWVRRFVNAGIPAGVINDVRQVFEDAQVQHCQLVRHAHHPVIGQVPHMAIPIRMASVDVQQPACAPPLLGEHTQAVLRSYGFGPEEIADLIARGVVTQHTAA